MSDDKNNTKAMHELKTSEPTKASFAPCHGWDAAVSAVDSYDHEIKILQEAQRIIEKNELPRYSWQTWDVFSGRMVDHLEATDRWTVRVLQQARENVKHPNGQTLRPARAAEQKGNDEK